MRSETISNENVSNYKVLNLVILYVFTLILSLSDFIWKGYEFICSKAIFKNIWLSQLPSEKVTNLYVQKLFLRTFDLVNYP
jgi:hypothetical protein